MMPNDYTDEFFIDHLKSHNPNGDILESFLEDIAENTPSWNTKKIQQLASNSESICSPGIITIDDREYNTSERRNYAKDLSAEDCLALPRFGHEEYPDADRRLISASKLDSSVLLTLVRTSHCHQVGPLREALAKHISCKTYLRAYESYDGYPTPYLELQLPWLALRELSDDGTGSSGDEATQKPWSDVPLPVESSKGKTKYGRFAIYRGHVTLLAIKWNDRKSTIYRFHKACPFGPEISESDASQSQDGISDDEDEENEIDPEPEEDILVPPGGGYDLDANTPIWDMEKYFLRCAAIWARLAVREYTTLVRTLEESVDAWVSKSCYRNYARTDAPQNDVLSLPALNPSCDEQVEHTSRLHKIVDTMQLLSKICQDLQLATQTWEGFIAPDGDLAFFGDLTDPDVRRPYRDLKSSFRELGILEKALKHRHTTCKELARRVRCRTDVELTADGVLASVATCSDQQHPQLQKHRLESTRT